MLKEFLLLVCILGLTRAQSELDEATQVLSSLVRESEQKLQDLDDYWAVNGAILEAEVDEIYQEFLGQEQECKDRESGIVDTDDEVTNTETYISWVGEKIAENENKLTALEDAHCETQMIYINGLKHNKIALNLITFIRRAIENRDSFSFAQRRQFIGQLDVFFQMYAAKEYNQLLQLKDDTLALESEFDVEARTDEQIGEDHVDSEQGDLELEGFQSTAERSWPQYKADLLALLDTIETKISEKVESSQDEQINSGVTLAEFKIRVEKEQRDLDRLLVDEAERVTRLEAKKVRQGTLLTECKAQLDVVFNTLLSTRADYDDRVYKHEQKRNSLQEEVEVLQYVERQYLEQVEGTPGSNREVDAIWQSMQE